MRFSALSESESLLHPAGITARCVHAPGCRQSQQPVACEPAREPTDPRKHSQEALSVACGMAAWAVRR